MTDAPRNPSKLAPSQQKDQKNQNKSRKTKEKPFGPWPSLPSAVLVIVLSPQGGTGWDHHDATRTPRLVRWQPVRGRCAPPHSVAGSLTALTRREPEVTEPGLRTACSLPVSVLSNQPTQANGPRARLITRPAIIVASKQDTNGHSQNGDHHQYAPRHDSVHGR